MNGTGRRKAGPAKNLRVWPAKRRATAPSITARPIEKNALVAVATALEGAGTSGLLGAGPSPLLRTGASAGDADRSAAAVEASGRPASGGVNVIPPAAGCGPRGRLVVRRGRNRAVESEP